MSYVTVSLKHESTLLAAFSTRFQHRTEVSTIQVLVAACECDQRCRCVYLHWKLSVKRMIIR